MATNYRKIVRELMDALGLKQAAFADHIGASQASVSRWVSGVHPDPRWAEKLTLLHRQSLGLSDHMEMTTQVKVMGRIGAGAEILPEFEQVAPEGLFSVELGSPVEEEAIAFVVEGDSMWPRFNDGDVVICGDPIMSASDVIGQEAAVRTSDGRRFLKRVRSGSEAGYFDLESHNGPLIRDVKL